jgi:hypothetical protein
MAKLTEDFLVNLARDRFTESRNWVDEEIKDRWRKSNDLYDSKFEESERQKSDVLLGQGRLFIPKTYSHTQRILVDLLDTYFFDKEEIVDISSWGNIESEKRLIAKTLLNYRLNGHPINFYEESYEACLNALKNKVGIFKVYPKFQDVKFKIGEESETFKVYHPVIENLPYEDVFFYPKATWKDYWKHPIVHRMVKTLDYLKRRRYKNLDVLEFSQIDDTAMDEIKEQRSLDQGSPFGTRLNTKVKNANEVYIFEIWDFLDVNNDGLLESCSYICAGDAQGPAVLIRDVEENTLPYKSMGEDYNRSPFVMGSAFPESHKLYGKDMPEVVEGLQKETNSLRNQRREAVAIAIRRPILASRAAGLDLLALVNRRISSVVMGDDISPSSVRELDIKDPTAGSVMEQQRTDQDFFETTSIPPNLLGAPTHPRETATGVSRHEANANKKISMVIKNLAYTLFLPAFKMLLRLEQEYVTDDFVEMVTGKRLGWKFASDSLPPKEVIQGDFDLMINLNISKQTQLNRLMLVMDRANVVNQSTALLVQGGVLKPQDAKFINSMTIFDRMLPLLGEKDIDEFKIQVQQPPPQEGQLPGVASQPALQNESEVGQQLLEGEIAI